MSYTDFLDIIMDLDNIFPFYKLYLVPSSYILSCESDFYLYNFPSRIYSYCKSFTTSNSNGSSCQVQKIPPLVNILQGFAPPLSKNQQLGR